MDPTPDFLSLTQHNDMLSLCAFSFEGKSNARGVLNEPQKPPQSAQHQVHFIQGDNEWTTTVDDGTSLLQAARLCDAPVHTLCNGIGACVQCKIKVIENNEALSKPNDLERDRIGNIFHITGERLGCQALVYGDVVIEPLPVRLPKRKLHKGSPPGRR